MITKYLPNDSKFNYTPKIDSVAIYLDAQQCNIINAFEDTFIVAKHSGVILEEKQQRKLFKEDERQGIKIYLSLVTFPNGDSFVRLILTAKMLKQFYFEGITLSNVSKLWQTLRYYLDEYITFSYETFLNSNINDLDIAFDFYCDEVDYQNYISSIQFLDNVKTYKKNNQYQGVEFSNRSTKTYKKPYIKIYNKYLELYTRSENFTDCFLDIKAVQGLRRLEITLKNSEFFKRYFGVKSVKLIELLEMQAKPRYLYTVALVYLQTYFNGRSLQLLNVEPKKCFKFDLDTYILNNKKDFIIYFLVERLEWATNKDKKNFSKLDTSILDHINYKYFGNRSSSQKMIYRFKKKFPKFSELLE